MRGNKKHYNIKNLICKLSIFIQPHKLFFKQTNNWLESTDEYHGNALVTDLNIDIMFLIFDELDFISIIKMGQTNKQFSTLATEYITRHFSLSNVHLRNGCTGRTQRPFLREIGKNSIEIYNFNSALSILKQFGSRIRKLTVDTVAFTSEQLEIVAGRINEYCADTLTTLHLIGVDSILSNLTELKAIEDLRLFITYERNLNRPKLLNQQFPKLRRLNLKILPNADIQFVDCAFPNLDSIGLECHHATLLVPYFYTIRQILTRNPIRSMSFQNFPLDFLTVVNEVSPHLEHLSIGGIRGDRLSREIRFQHVKTFNFTNIAYSDSITQFFKFPKLKNLQVLYNDNQKWADFFATHKNLTKLHIHATKTESRQHLNDFNFQQLLQLQDLTEFSLVFPGGVLQTNDIFYFLNAHPKLTKCEFAMRPYGEHMENVIQFALGWNWIIDDFPNIENISSGDTLKGFSLKKRKVTKNFKF